MSYQTGPGLPERELPAWLAAAARRLGTFADGRVNYKRADLAPAVMCVLLVGDEFLLAKRGHGLADANGVWSIINGFIDEPKPVAAIAANELAEELGLTVDPAQIKVAPSILVSQNTEARDYIIFPCLVRLAQKPAIRLDREHTDYAWIKRPALDKYDFLPDLPLIIDTALGLK